jgi:hypothetical protein
LIPATWTVRGNKKASSINSYLWQNPMRVSERWLRVISAAGYGFGRSLTMRRGCGMHPARLQIYGF